VRRLVKVIWFNLVLTGREKGESSAQVQKLEGQLRESRTRIEKLELENRNMKIELDMISR
jgi:TolA-binding protein